MSEQAVKKSHPAANEGLPLFYQAPHAIDKERHAHAGIRAGAHFAFATQCNSIPLNTIEFIDAARSQEETNMDCSSMRVDRE